MHTELYPNKTAAVYHDGATAEAAAMALEAAGLENVSVLRLAPGDSTVDQAIEPETGATRNTVTRDTMTGGAAGTAAGAAAAGTLAVTAPALLVRAPVVAPLIILGYGAAIGATAGAVRGLRLRETVLAGLVRDALDAGYYVIIVHAANDEAQRRAQAVIDDTVTEQTAHT